MARIAIACSILIAICLKSLPTISGDAIVADPPIYKPGFTVTWNTSQGASRSTFIKYDNDSDCPLAPCAKWIGYYWNGNAYYWLDRNLNEYKRETTDGQRIARRAYSQTLRFPLKVGHSWVNKFHYVGSPGTGESDVTQTVTVIGWEKIKIPAGEFEAIHFRDDRFYTSASATGPYSGKSVWENYYVPSLGIIAKWDGPGNQGEATQTEFLSMVPK